MRHTVAIAAFVAIAIAVVLLLVQVKEPSPEAKTRAATPEKIASPPDAADRPADAAPEPIPAADAAATAEPPEIVVRPGPDTRLPSDVAKSVADRQAEREAARAVKRVFSDARYEEARDAALEVLERFPENRDMRRLVVTSSCIMKDKDTAQSHYAHLEPADQARVVPRCEAYGIALVIRLD